MSQKRCACACALLCSALLSAALRLPRVPSASVPSQSQHSPDARSLSLLRPLLASLSTPSDTHEDGNGDAPMADAEGGEGEGDGKEYPILMRATDGKDEKKKKIKFSTLVSAPFLV